MGRREAASARRAVGGLDRERERHASWLTRQLGAATGCARPALRAPHSDSPRAAAAGREAAQTGRGRAARVSGAGIGWRPDRSKRTLRHSPHREARCNRGHLHEAADADVCSSDTMEMCPIVICRVCKDRPHQCGQHRTCCDCGKLRWVGDHDMSRSRAMHCEECERSVVQNRVCQIERRRRRLHVDSEFVNCRYRQFARKDDCQGRRRQGKECRCDDALSLRQVHRWGQMAGRRGSGGGRAVSRVSGRVRARPARSWCRAAARSRTSDRSAG